jgi:hypothetical protein
MMTKLVMPDGFDRWTLELIKKNLRIAESSSVACSKEIVPYYLKKNLETIEFVS